MTTDTFSEAMRLADVALRPGWVMQRPTGGFYVAEDGWEDQWGWAVTVGPADRMPTEPTHIVTKAGGTVRAITAADTDRLAEMDRVTPGM